MAELAPSVAQNIINNTPARPLYRKANLPLPVEPVGPRVKFDRNLFVEGFAGQPAMSPDKRHHLEGVVPGEKVEFQEKTVAGIRGFATDYVKRIIRLQNEPAPDPTDRANGLSAYDVIRREDIGSGNSIHNYDDMIVSLVTVKDPKTHRLVFNEDSFNEAMKNPEVWEAVQQIGNITAREILASVGAHAELRPTADRTDPNLWVGHEIDFRIQGGSQGPLNRWYRAITRWWRNPTEIDGRAQDLTHGQQLQQVVHGLATGALIGGLAGTEIGGIAGNVPGALVGAAIGIPSGALIAAGGVGIARLSQNGVHLALVRDENSLTRNQSNAMSVRTRLLYGIDAKDFAWDGDNLVLYANTPGSTRIGAAISEAIGLIGLRALYTSDLKIPPQKIDALPEQFIYAARNNFHESSKEETDIHMDDEIYQTFRELGGVDADQEVSIERWMKAQSVKVSDRLNKIIVDRGAKTITDPYSLTPLQDKITARTGENGNDPAELTRRNQALQERLTRQTADRTALQADRDSFVDYARATRTTRKSVDAAQRDVNSFISSLRTGGTGYTTAQEAIDALQDLISDPAAAAMSGIKDENGRTLRLINPLAPLYTAVEAWESAEQTRISGLAARLQPDALQALDVAKARRLAPIDAQRQQVEKMIEMIQGRDTTLQEARRQFDNSPEAQTVAETVNSLQTAYNEVLDFAPNPAVRAAWEATIRTLDFNTLIGAINAQNAVDPTVGWPAAENNTAENRELLYRAMAEARAQEALNTNPNRATQEPQYIALTTGNVGRYINPQQLRTLTSQEIFNIVDPLYTSGVLTPPPPRPGIPDIDNARNWAALEYSTRQDAILGNLREVRRDVAITEAALNTARVDITRQQQQLMLVSEIAQAEDKGTLNEKVMLAVGNREQQIYLTTAANAVTGGMSKNSLTYTVSEDGIPQSVLEVIDLLTGYQTSNNREQNFQQILENLDNLCGNRAQLAGDLLDAFFPGVLGIPNTLNGFALEMERLRVSGSLNPIVIRQGMERFARILIGRGLALP